MTLSSPSATSANGPERDFRLEGFAKRAREELVHHIRDISNGGDVVHAGYCTHANAGDNAISESERLLLRAAAAKCRVVVPCDHPSWVDRAGRWPDASIVLHGGGNIGDLYGHEMASRIEVIRAWRRPILQMPQSIHFERLAAAEPFRRAVAESKGFRLLVRDQASYDWAQQYLECQTILAPDAVLTFGPLPRSRQPAFDVLALVRADTEASGQRGPLPQGVRAMDWTPEPRARHDLRHLPVYAYDRWSLQESRRIIVRMAKVRFARGLRTVALGQVVITDRLHAVILCLLQGIPVVAVDNSYGKVSAQVNTWRLGELGQVELASSFSEAYERAEAIARAM